MTSATVCRRWNGFGAAARSICAALFLVAAGPSFASTLVGVVVGIQDGDTLTVLDAEQVQHRIRLSGIDAPEKGQPFGHRSKEGLSAIAYRRQVAVEWHKRDRYGRLVGKVLVEGRDINLAQISSGLAWHFANYAKEQRPLDRQLYAEAQTDAKQHRIGLWRDPSPTPPWDYRRGKRTTPM
ncbi:thermonuclease family protein [Piscinibacter aquaticus]|uniref:Thermonuclease family protein n=1 Tax=Piscinibacter aquaticus TaxID=392597 RepID=A0A5C6U272_9BURK|nr:thermonuclease family protein [Piscinibacter aquaticus]